MLLSKLKKEIESKIPKDVSWVDLEVETILLELGLESTTKNRDSIEVLRIFSLKPDLFFNDILFFLYVIDVINGGEVDFETVNIPNSLEVAFAVYEVTKIYGLKIYHELPKFETGVVETVKFILINDGYSEIVEPFDVFGVTKLTPGQHKQDTENKRKAIKEYVSTMYN